MSARPLVVLLTRPDAVEPAARRLREDGWKVHTGWSLPAEPWDQRGSRTMCSGVIDDLDTARAAVGCLRRADGIVTALDLVGADAPRVLADLHRLGDVKPEIEAEAPALAISAEQRELLELVADGASVPEAAAQLYLSARTAERRLAMTRKALGVRSTAEAIALLLAAKRAGR